MWEPGAHCVNFLKECRLDSYSILYNLILTMQLYMTHIAQYVNFSNTKGVGVGTLDLKKA